VELRTFVVDAFVTGNLDFCNSNAVPLKLEVSMATLPIHRFTAQQVSHSIITAAMRVHTELGPG
jgi:hypothetical protein